MSLVPQANLALGGLAFETSFVCEFNMVSLVTLSIIGASLSEPHTSISSSSSSSSLHHQGMFSTQKNNNKKLNTHKTNWHEKSGEGVL